MRSFFKKCWNRTGRNYLIIGLFCLLGGALLLILVPFNGMDEFVYLISAILLAVGIFLLVMGITADKKTDIWPLGAVFIVLALWMMFRNEFVLKHLYLIFGLTVLAGGLIDLYHYIRLRLTYGEPEILPILVSAISAILGIVILVNPFAGSDEIFRFSGVAFLGRGVLSLLYYRKLQEKN